MENQIFFQPASELTGEDISRIKSGYVRGAIVRELIITVTVRRITYLYAVVDNNFCNIWANPLYGKGTEVYLLEVGSGMTEQKVMVSK